MWIIVDQQAVDELNEAVNQQWYFVQHLQNLSSWRGTDAMCDDVLQLRENIERISECLNEAILWEQFA